MSSVENIASLVRYIEIEEDEIVVHADESSFSEIYDYLCSDRAIIETEEGKIILKRDEQRKKKFNFVLQCAYVLERYITQKEENIPPDLFYSITGYEDIKRVFLQSLRAKKPVHILLYGPPSTAKSLFMNELERLPDSVLVLGGELTRPGLRDIIAEWKPRFLIIDELDKIKDANELSSILSWMEHGKLIIGKYKNYKRVTGKGWVFAGANQIYKLPRELLSRFMKFFLREYSDETLKKVIYETLYVKEKIAPELAFYIAERLNELGYKDVRDAVRISRLSEKKEDVEKILEVMEHFKQEARGDSQG